jgi:hypothetical protein
VQVRYGCEDLTALRRRVRTFKGDIEKMPRGRLPKITPIAATRKLLIAVITSPRIAGRSSPRVVAPADTFGALPKRRRAVPEP